MAYGPLSPIWRSHSTGLSLRLTVPAIDGSAITASASRNPTTGCFTRAGYARISPALVKTF
jgi:hypothetical protein